jgi:uncharacterized protein
LNRALCALVCVGVLACNHADTGRGQPASAPPALEQPAASPAPSTPDRAAIPNVAPAPTAAVKRAARCVVPWSSAAPPRAQPATACPAAPAAGPSLPQGMVVFLDAPSKPQVSIERAIDDDARTLGLMYRTELARDGGMIFSWDEEEVRSFWMRNTCIPLDMLFIAGDGTIVGILEQVPTLNTLPRSIPCPARHVLELNAGWAREHGVEPGQRVQIDT